MADHKRDKAEKLISEAGYKPGEVNPESKFSHEMRHEKKTRDPFYGDGFKDKTARK